MKNWDDFYDYVLPDLPSCETALAGVHIRSAAIDFMDKSGVYVVDGTPITLVADDSTYALTAPAEYDIARIHTLWYDGVEISPVGEDVLRRALLDWPTATGEPRGFIQETQDTVRFVPIPDDVAATKSVTLRVVLKPARDGAGVEDWIFNKWVEAISFRAKATLMTVAGKPFTNQQEADRNEARYRAAMADALADATRGLARAQLQVQMRRFGR